MTTRQCFGCPRSHKRDQRGASVAGMNRYREEMISARYIKHRKEDGRGAGVEGGYTFKSDLGRQRAEQCLWGPCDHVGENP